MNDKIERTHDKDNEPVVSTGGALPDPAEAVSVNSFPKIITHASGVVLEV